VPLGPIFAQSKRIFLLLQTHAHIPYTQYCCPSRALCRSAPTRVPWTTPLFPFCTTNTLVDGDATTRAAKDAVFGGVATCEVCVRFIYSTVICPSAGGARKSLFLHNAFFLSRIPQYYPRPPYSCQSVTAVDELKYVRVRVYEKWRKK
jgi:hypothetical protein